MIFQIPAISSREREVIAEIEQLARQLAFGVHPRRWVGLLRRNTFAQALRGSNSIEGYHVSVDDAVAAVVGEEPLDPKTEAWAAVVGYQAAMTYVLQKADDLYFSYSPELLQSLQFMMTGHDLTKNPGRWRPGAIFVRDDSTGERVYEGAPQEQVPGLIGELVEGLNTDRASHPLVVAALAHLSLVMIHPFSDGNGRMARCLQTLVLARSGSLHPGFNSIEEYLGANTRAYYDVLAEVGGGSWQPQRDCRPWLRFCLTAHYRQALTLKRRARQLERIWNELEVETEKRGFPERVLLALTDAASGFRVRNATYRKVAEISESVAARDLKALVEAELLVAKGEKRGRHYLASPALQALRERTDEPRSMPDPFDMTLGHTSSA